MNTTCSDDSSPNAANYVCPTDVRRRPTFLNS